MKTKIILGVSIAAAVLFGGLFLWQVRKSGMDAEKIRAYKNQLDKNAEDYKILEKALEQSRESEAAAEAFLTDARADVAKYRDREQIYVNQIKIDSLLLDEIKISDAKNDSLRLHYTPADWDCYIAGQIGENCN